MKRVKDAAMQTRPASTEAPSPFDSGEASQRLVADEALQIRRGGLDPRTVKRYEDAMRMGQEFPAVQAFSVDGVLYLVDGFHRYAAAKLSGTLDRLEVVVSGHGTWDEARWCAFEANRRHGLPLKTKDLRVGFQAYVRAHRHRDKRGRLKSYREMAKDMGVGHTTLRGWLKADFPSVFRAMRGHQEGNGTSGPPPVPRPSTRSIPTSPQEMVEQAALVAEKHADDAEANWELLEALERFAEQLRRRPRHAPEF